MGLLLGILLSLPDAIITKAMVPMLASGAVGGAARGLGGQMAMPELVDAYLRRIERNEHGLALRLYPFTRKRQLDEPRVVAIDPRISFGRPVLVGTGIRTAIVAERYKAGESIEELAKDYGRKSLDIEEAIRCELAVEAA